MTMTKTKGKGYATGKRNGNAKLSDAKVKQIRAQLAAGLSQSDVARDMGVSRQLINAIVKGRRREPHKASQEPVRKPVGSWDDIQNAPDLPVGSMATFRTHSRFGRVD